MIALAERSRTRIPRGSIILAIAALAGCAPGPARSPATEKRAVLADRGYFFVGGRYEKTKDGQIRVGQMYVQYEVPENRRSDRV
jgi:hypothetical protein